MQRFLTFSLMRYARMHPATAGFAAMLLQVAVGTAVFIWLLWLWFGA